MCKQLAKQGHQARIPNALTTRPLSYSIFAVIFKTSFVVLSGYVLVFL